MNIKRDKFLTEVIGECWHDSLGESEYSYDEQESYDTCSKCGELTKDRNNFSTWEGFGKLWEWAQQQEWWYRFLDNNTKCYTKTELQSESCIVKPDRFADAVYSYLNENTHV